MKKQIRTKIGNKLGKYTTEIERQDWSIKVYSFETNRHHERRVWFNRSGLMFVQLGGQFWEVVTEMEGKYRPWLCMEYVEVK